VRPEHQERFQRIVNDYLERPGGDYAELLNRGRVSSPDGVDAEQWREWIRAQARRDKIAVVTFRDGDRAIAVRQRSVSDEEVRYELDRMQVLTRLALRQAKVGLEDLGVSPEGRCFRGFWAGCEPRRGCLCAC
jgi:hypothetical protein